jgi:hydroxymethylpyrimidine/phosphomethylpyrimidine kinase
MEDKIKTVLCIGAADTAGGTGIGTDIKTLQSLGIESLHVYTAIIAQNKTNVHTMIEIPADVVKEQLQSVSAYKKFDAVKIGIIPSARIAWELGTFLKTLQIPVVLDISLKNREGIEWGSQDTILAVIENIIPYTTIFTPNKYEAEVFSGMPIDTLEDAQVAVQRMAQLNYDMYVLLKGRLFSHTFRADEYGDKWCSDILYYKNDFYLFEAPTVTNTQHLGSGDIYSACIAAQLTKLQDITEAVRISKEFVSYAVKNAVNDMSRIKIQKQGFQN